jgi:LysM repeat protein
VALPVHFIFFPIQEVVMLTDKYRPLLDLANKLHIGNINTAEENGKLVIKGTATYQLEKDALWDQIKSFSGWENEVAADIQVANNDIYGEYKVQSGDTLSKIAKKYLGNANKYMDIVKTNSGTITDPDKISVGQTIKIPNK